MQGFISYSHLDTERVEKLRKQLHPVTRVLGIDLWIDERIRAGEVWDRKIKDALDRASPWTTVSSRVSSWICGD